VIPRACIPDDELLLAPTWAAGDPRHDHVRTCARCRSLWLEIQSAEREATDAPAPSPREAERLERAVREGLDLAPVSAARPEAPVARPGAPRPAFWRTAPGLGALAVAACAVIVAAVVLAPRGPGPAPGVRGEAEAGALALLPPEVAGDAVMLRWRSVPGAETYRVELLGEDFGERLARNTGTDTTVTLRADTLRGQELWWRVSAEAGGVRLVQSEPSALRWP
jgi:hypothetical protein